MRYSRLLGKTSKTDFSGATLKSHQLLLRGGFIRESVAGRYFLLPLGWRVHARIQAIIKDEMDRAGAQEMLAPTLHPLELWQETNRDNAQGFGLMEVTDRRGAKFALGGTAEEMFVDVVRKLRPISHRDLPFNVYQFSNKFRDEMRARGGLLRVREFIMKDAYSFHADEADFVKEYEKMADVYDRIFRRCGLEPVRVLADNGYIGGEYCHEFQVECEAGEGTFFLPEGGDPHPASGRPLPEGEGEAAKSTMAAVHEDVATFARGEMNPDEAVLPMETVALPTNVCDIRELEAHYGQPAWRFLKNVAFKNTATGEIIIVTIRGDLQVNKTKLEKHLRAAECLEEASAEDLSKIGERSGSIHSWGNPAVRYLGDLSLTSVRNFYGGWKTETTDPINVNFGRDFTCELADVALAFDGARTEDGKILRERRGVEVGNIFQLGFHYSTKMKNAVFMDTDGSEKPFYMGCYGIGVGRTLQTIIEKHADEHGIIWPDEVAPYRVHLASLPGGEVEAERIYDELGKAGVDVLWDDRADVRAGEKFADADLIGCPLRLVVSGRGVEAGEVEIKDRRTGEVRHVPLGDVVSELTK